MSGLFSVGTAHCAPARRPGGRVATAAIFWHLSGMLSAVQHCSMRTTSVCVVRPPKAERALLAEGLRILARATRTVFARVYQRREDEARVKRDVCAAFGLLVRHYSGCRADAAAAARGWREGAHRAARASARPPRGARGGARERREVLRAPAAQCGGGAQGGGASCAGREGAPWRAAPLLWRTQASAPGTHQRVARSARWQRPLRWRDGKARRQRGRSVGPGDGGVFSSSFPAVCRPSHLMASASPTR